MGADGFADWVWNYRRGEKEGKGEEKVAAVVVEPIHWGGEDRKRESMKTEIDLYSVVYPSS